MTEHTNYIQDFVLVRRPVHTQSIYARVAALSFVLLLFFALFGTSLPFQERAQDVEDIGTSNIGNQIIYSLLFLTSVFSLLPKGREMISFLKGEKFFTLFLLWCLLSIIWSDFSFVSFKRVFQFFAIVTVILAVLLHSPSLDEILKSFKYIFSIYIILSFLAVLFVPEAIDHRMGAWKGLTLQKNLLGQASLVSIIIWFHAFRSPSSLVGKFFSFLMLSISLVLLFGAKSSTALIAFTILTIAALLFLIDDLCKPIGFGRAFSTFAILSCLGIIISVVLLAPNLTDSILGSFGKDITFTGRSALWADTFEEAKKHLLLGTGFQGFWVIENVNVLDLYEIYTWLPNQAHNGYLDILNEMGLVGISLFFLMIIFYFRNLLKLNKPHFWKWFFIAAIIINATESTMFKPRHISGVMFVFSYFALYIELFRQERNKKLVLYNRINSNTPYGRENVKVHD